MKILFLNLPYKYRISRASRWPEKTKSGTLYYPYWLAYAAGFSKKQGLDVKLIDAIARDWSFDRTIQEILLFNPDILVSEISTPTLLEDKKFFSLCRSMGFKGKILVAGNHATVFPKEILTESPEIDYVAFGEYDSTVADLVKNKGLPEKMLGIAWKKDGEIIINYPRPYIEDLDAFPFVSKIYKEYLNFNDYFYSLACHPMVQILSSRGCPCRCSFCLTPQTAGGKNYRVRSIKNFVDELEYISLELPQIKEVFIEDDTFAIDKRRVREICAMIISKGLKVRWSANVRADIDLETLVLMKKAGCRLIVVGFESGSQKILDLAEKGITVEQSRNFAVNAKKAGVKVFGCFMIGLPGETKETINETYELAQDMDLDMVFFQQAVPFPGTKFYQWAKSNKCLTTEDYGQWMDANGRLNSIVAYDGLSAKEIASFRDRLMVRYYFSPRYIIKTLIKNRDIRELMRIMFGAFNYLRYLLGRAF